MHNNLNNPDRIPARLAAAIVVAILLTACGGGEKKPPEPKPGAEQKAEAGKHEEGKHDEGTVIKLSEAEAKRAGIQLQALQPQSQADVVTVTATIRANQDKIARVASRVEGRITRVLVNLGDTVRAGQPLASLDSVALGEAQSAFLQSQASHRVAQTDFDRAKALAAEEIIPQREFLRAKAELDKSSAELRAAEDKLRLLGASPQRSGRAAAGFEVHAPFAGTVIEKKATTGELATPSDALFTVADLSRVWIEANLSEDLLSKVRPGANATVRVAAYPGERFAGKVTYIAGILNKDTRTIGARIEVDNKDRRLKPEMFATAVIETGTSKDKVLSVPDAAIVLLQGQPTVFVQERGGFEPRPVELGDKLGGRTVLKSGVDAGEQVVAAGAYALKARLLKSQISDEH
ncbi:efflux RND transporter periplasmic adaptor subunit [Piscinibacter terrae]|uniref:Efflux RND transporter periplasmic adaptor subunit n=1 Tax=Piscinibacter terrae TaxID=2496871 RepID=A0A3N7JKL7_9BURK|nr:efflux RND transporter periplasmic adaptor subunit [Albitalea terrae]RQP21849.1 efflux RND transporter periplasmic adaptor subunit [Albitalea terrae]